MGLLASNSQLDSVLGYIAKAKEDGDRLLIGGSQLIGEPFDNDHYVEPAIVEIEKNDLEIAQEEIFEPVLCLMKIDTIL
ncbi:aldehyde dehydrogenase [Jeotgalibacillus soli]|uniref:Aldehyde dehydrogenase n=2 Tax=Jeotgalibacillus soli TaxID=889306 RepID=A0A0C2VT78_9BACL|nr:aldehyde dehydrogenase [Jeotgalibacillus soli]